MSFVVYAGTGHRRVASFDTEEKAREYGREFDAYCWRHDCPVPPFWVKEEK